MDPDRQSFEALRRLLALKRHEQPPPGYYEHLRDRVLDRLQIDDEPEEKSE